MNISINNYVDFHFLICFHDIIILNSFKICYPWLHRKTYSEFAFSKFLKKNESSFLYLKWMNWIQNKFHLENGKWKFKILENRRNWREDYRKRDFQKYSVSSSLLKYHTGGWSLWRPWVVKSILRKIFRSYFCVFILIF